MNIKESILAKYLKNIFGKKNERDNLSDEEIIKLNYFECVSYLYKGKEKPLVLGFKEGVNIWLKTSIGDIDLDSIPHNKGHLTNNVYELEALIGENCYSEEYLIDLINQAIDENWRS